MIFLLLSGGVSISIEALGGHGFLFKNWGSSFSRYTLVPSMTTKTLER